MKIRKMKHKVHSFYQYTTTIVSKFDYPNNVFFTIPVKVRVNPSEEFRKMHLEWLEESAKLDADRDYVNEWLPWKPMVTGTPETVGYDVKFEVME